MLILCNCVGVSIFGVQCVAFLDSPLTDGNGTVTLDKLERVAMSASHSMDISEEEEARRLKRSFAAIDLNGDGQVTVTEVVSALEKNGTGKGDTPGAAAGDCSQAEQQRT